MYYARLRTFFRFLVEEGSIEASPMETLKAPVSRPDQIEPFTQEHVTALLAALNQLLGSNANLTTVNYYISPNYQNSPGNNAPTISGYTANSTVEMTLSVITLAGPAIDASVANGAQADG